MADENDPATMGCAREPLPTGDRADEAPEAAMRRLDRQLARLGAVARMAMAQRFRPPTRLEAGARNDPEAHAAMISQYDAGLALLTELTTLVDTAAVRALKVKSYEDARHRAERN